MAAKIEEKYFTITNPDDLPKEMSNNPKIKDFLSSLSDKCKIKVELDKTSESIVIKTEDKDIKVNVDEIFPKKS